MLKVKHFFFFFKLTDWNNHSGVFSHLEGDILEGEVKWALGNITVNKTTGSDGISSELFKILKGETIKVLQSIYQHI